MNDFLKGYSEGMTGTTGGQPSQSVLEAMGRDAARNQWNQPRNVNSSHAPAPPGPPGVPLHTALYEIGQRVSGKRLFIGFAIACALIMSGALLLQILPRAFEPVGPLLSLAGYIYMFYNLVRAVLFGIARVGGLFAGKNTKE